MLATRRYCQHTIAAIFCAELKLEPPCSLMARLTDRDKVDYLPVDWDDLAALFDMIAFPKDSDDDRRALVPRYVVTGRGCGVSLDRKSVV